MARESLTINGLDLMAGTNWDVEDLIVTDPGPSGDNPVVAGRVGSLWHQKTVGPGRIDVNMWVGNPAASRTQVWQWWEQIVAAVWRPHQLSTITWVMDGGATRVWLVELTGEAAPTRLGTKGYRARLEFQVPSGEMSNSA